MPVVWVIAVVNSCGDHPLFAFEYSPLRYSLHIHFFFGSHQTRPIPFVLVGYVLLAEPTS